MRDELVDLLDAINDQIEAATETYIKVAAREPEYPMNTAATDLSFMSGKLLGLTIAKGLVSRRINRDGPYKCRCMWIAKHLSRSHRWLDMPEL